jgi:hypothetical protein
MYYKVLENKNKPTPKWIEGNKYWRSEMKLINGKIMQRINGTKI